MDKMIVLGLSESNVLSSVTISGFIRNIQLHVSWPTYAFSYRVEDPPGLVELQNNEWDPVMDWIEKR